jgi:hypothetical protein
MKMNDISDVLYDLNNYQDGDDISVSMDFLKELLELAKKSIEYEETLNKTRSFANMYTTANNFENVYPELVANEVLEITNNALSKN